MEIKALGPQYLLQINLPGSPKAQNVYECYLFFENRVKYLLEHNSYVYRPFVKLYLCVATGKYRVELPHSHHSFRNIKRVCVVKVQ